MQETQHRSHRRLSQVVRALAVAAIVIPLVFAAIHLWNRDPAQPARLGELVHPGAAAGWNVLLVTLDTTRPDHLGCYGYAAAETPTIDALASCGVRFDEAVTSAPITLPSHSTIMTGLIPPNHGVRDNGTHELPGNVVTLAELLKGQGYDTAAFVGCFVLDARYGLDQGFDTYDFSVPEEGFREANLSFNERPADAVTDAAIKWLDSRTGSAPFFAWVHYFDPHQPYSSPTVGLQRFDGRPYDAEIAYVDMHLARLIARLKDRGLADRTLVVVASDHGEGLGEHGETTHGFLLYDSTVRVALIISSPMLFDGPYRVEDRLVGLVDILPTLASMLGMDSPEGLDGVNLLDTDFDADRVIYMETMYPYYAAGCSPSFGGRRRDAKFILSSRPDYYDLRRDPHETVNRYGDTPTVNELSKQLEAIMNGWEEDWGRSNRRLLTSDERDRLTALGYIHSDTAGQGATQDFTQSDIAKPLETLTDPKHFLQVFEMAEDAQRLRRQGELTEALARARQAVDRLPTFQRGSRVLASILLDAGRPEEAIACLRKSLEVAPDYAATMLLAEILCQLNRSEEAYELLDKAIQEAPQNGNALMVRGDCLVQQGQCNEAIKTYQEAARLDENRVGIAATRRIERARSLQNGESAP